MNTEGIWKVGWGVTDQCLTLLGCCGPVRQGQGSVSPGAAPTLSRRQVQGPCGADFWVFLCSDTNVHGAAPCPLWEVAGGTEPQQSTRRQPGGVTVHAGLTA